MPSRLDRQRLRLAIVGVALVAGVALAFSRPPFAQDPAYHAFADQRAFGGLPNFWNVVTNLPFLIVGAYGLRRLPRLRRPELAMEFGLFAAGVLLVALGSTWYHLAPSNATLVWDRLPMTVGFMALFALVVRDRLSGTIGRHALWPLLVVGAGSVFYWQATELHGAGDLRPYYLVQFLPMVLIPILLLTGPGCGGLRTAWIWATLAIYLVAKQAESHDRALYVATGLLSGHSLKHLVAALAVLCAVLAALRSRSRPPAALPGPAGSHRPEGSSTADAAPDPARHAVTGPGSGLG